MVQGDVSSALAVARGCKPQDLTPIKRPSLAKPPGPTVGFVTLMCGTRDETRCPKGFYITPYCSSQRVDRDIDSDSFSCNLLSVKRRLGERLEALPTRPPDGSSIISFPRSWSG